MLIWTRTVAGLVIGLLLAVVVEVRDSSLKREEDVVRVLSLPVLALVPMIASKQERRRRQLGGIAANVAAAVALLGSMAILVVWRLHS